MAVLEHPIGVFVELRKIARLRAREPAHRHPADTVGALGVFVLPGGVIARARGQDIDLMPLGQPLGDEPAVVFRTTENLPVTLPSAPPELPKSTHTQGTANGIHAAHEHVQKSDLGGRGGEVVQSEGEHAISHARARAVR